jgi:hypothetical protein
VHRLILAVVIVLAAGCAAPAQSPQPTAYTGPKIDVIWVPSDVVVVRKMLQMAGVGPADIVYDLGSGDGRIVIMAAREFGARGVGVDIDPQQIARANAVTTGVPRHVRRAGSSPPTSARPRWWRSISARRQPETPAQPSASYGQARASSRTTTTWGLKPEQSATVDFDNREHLVFLWRVPQR